MVRFRRRPIGHRVRRSGLPAGPDSYLFTDIDAALEIAGASDIRLVFVLLDHRWMFEGVPDIIADPVTGALLEARLPDGRAQVLDTHARTPGADAERSSSRSSGDTAPPVNAPSWAHKSSRTSS